MADNYGEFQGTELDPEFDLDLEDEEENDLVPILALSAVFAAIVGAILLLLGRRRKPTPQERAQEVLKEARKRGRRGAEAVARTVEDIKLRDLLDDAQSRARRAAAAVPAGAVAPLLQEAIEQAAKATGRLSAAVAPSASEAQERATRLASSVKAPDLDLAAAGGVLDTLKERLAEAVESVRSDIAPSAAERLRSEVIPAAREAAETVARRVKEDVAPAAQERAGKIAEDYQLGPRARMASAAARQGAGTATDVLRGVALAVLSKVVQDVLPQARKAGGQAVRTAREDVVPAAAQRVREDVIPTVGQVAAQTPEVLSEVLKVARRRVEAAIERTQPAAADVLTFSRHRARDVATGMLDRRDGIAVPVKSARRGVTGAVGGAVNATRQATREATGTIFWLSVLGGVALMVFEPDRERQKEIMNNIRQVAGELREMWRDLQGSDLDLETATQTGTLQY